MVRDNRIDSLKGMLIILVILGHVLTMLDNANTVNHAVMGLIYMFHMPLFILISGYLTKSPETQPSRDMWRGVLSIFVTILVFQVLCSIRVVCMGGYFVEAITSFPFDVMWYLMCLVYWRILLYFTPKALYRRPWVHLAIALVISVLSGLTYLGNLLALQRAMNFYFFFLLGHYYRHGMLDVRWWRNNYLHAGITVVLLPLIFWLFPHCGNVMNGADHYPLSGIPEKLLILSCSVAMSIGLFNIFRDYKPLRMFGKDSLFYFLYHKIVILVVFMPLVRHHGWPTSFPFMLIYTAVVVVILFGMSKIPLLRWFIHPIKSLNSRGGKVSQ